MVRDVLVEVGQAQQEFQQVRPFGRVVRAAALRQDLRGNIALGENPIDCCRLDRAAFLTEFESRGEPIKRRRQIMLQANSLTSQGRRNLAITIAILAAYLTGHNTPPVLAARSATVPLMR